MSESRRRAEEGLQRYFRNWRSLGGLVRDRIGEGKDIEFKRDPYGDTRKPKEVQKAEKEELRRDFVAMANGGGGWIILGIGQNDLDQAAEVCPFDGPARYEAIIKDNLMKWVQPRLRSSSFSLRRVLHPDSKNKGLIILRVEPSLPSSPLAAIIDQQPQFWRRIGKDKRLMEYAEIRDGFREFDPDEDDRAVDAVAVNDVRKMRWAIEGTRAGAKRDWDRAVPLIDQLALYANDYGVAVALEVLEAARCITDLTRFDTPTAIVERVKDIIETATFSAGLHRYEPEDRIRPQQLRFAREIISCAWSLVWDGTRYLKNIRVVWAGIELMMVVGRWSRKNGVGDLPVRMLDHLQAARKMAEEKNLRDVMALLEWAMIDRDDEPVRLDDLPEQLYQAIASAR